MPRRSSAKDLPWDSEAELVGITLMLKPQRDVEVPSNFSMTLHSWFLNQVRLSDPELSAYLHDGQSEKAFTISGLEGEPVGEARSLLFRSNQTYAWTVTGLNRDVCEWLCKWVVALPQEMKLRSERFEILEWRVSLPAIAYESVWDRFEHGDEGEVSLTFLSATSFRKRQNHMPLPIPENVFHSYLRRWNNFASITVEQDDFLEWVNECVVILRHELRSRKVQAGKQGSVTGFVGQVQFGLTPKAYEEPEYVQMVRSLVCCAPYFGTGHKVTFGLGQTRSGWLEEGKREPEQVQKGDLIEVRRLELKGLFFGLKKRQGGERAEKAADLWATIVARQEFGESLKGIAEDLGVSYESVKKYAQLARKAIESLNASL
jgi:CRISPR-associated endoribonuclease Cas6